MLDRKSYITVEVSSEKNFGITFSFISFIAALYLLIESNNIFILFFILSFIFLICSFVIPKMFMTPNLLWFKFGVLLGSITAPIVMALVYFTIILLTGIIMKVFGGDLMPLKANKSVKSYWLPRTVPVGSMKNQF